MDKSRKIRPLLWNLKCFYSKSGVIYPLLSLKIKEKCKKGQKLWGHCAGPFLDQMQWNLKFGLEIPMCMPHKFYLVIFEICPALVLLEEWSQGNSHKIQFQTYLFREQNETEDCWYNSSVVEEMQPAFDPKVKRSNDVIPNVIYAFSTWLGLGAKILK